ncbi:hypothetical protein V6N11_039646 [Hibiscus sabdariffa]|uniref:DUF4283 domain-containing protein n=1 Tax=Hibiscus sabdariffa TaxID=183260 RepID=A0ABR2SPF9_9ROSI
MGESNGDTMQEDDPFEDDDIEILRGNVVRKVVDGLISIQFSNRVHSLAEKSFDRTLVLKLHWPPYGHLDDIFPMDATDPNATINMVLPTLTQPTKSETVAFGPWMLVEKLQRRHAHVLVDDMGVWVDNDARRSRGVMEHVVVPRQQGKLNEGDKQQRAVPVRKPLTIDDFPIVSKPNPKVGSSRVASRKSNTVLLEKSRHSAVVISKNSNPNCPGMDVDLGVSPTIHDPLIRGKPLDSCVNLPPS